jgi:hypothetical protein
VVAYCRLAAYAKRPRGEGQRCQGAVCKVQSRPWEYHMVARALCGAQTAKCVDAGRKMRAGRVAVWWESLSAVARPNTIHDVGGGVDIRRVFVVLGSCGHRRSPRQVPIGAWSNTCRRHRAQNRGSSLSRGGNIQPCGLRVSPSLDLRVPKHTCPLYYRISV